MTDTGGAAGDERSPDLGSGSAAVATLRRAAEQLNDTIAAPRAVTSPGGLTEVVAVAARLRSVTLGRTVVDRIGHGVDHVALSAELLTACRQALVVPADLGGRPAEEPTGGAAAPNPALVAEFARRSFPGQSHDGLITATVAATGALTELAVAASAVRGEALAGVGDGVVEAVNAALDACRRARRETFGLPDLGATLAAQTDAFVKRMEAVKATIDSSRTRLQGKLSEAEALLAQRRR